MTCQLSTNLYLFKEIHFPVGRGGVSIRGLNSRLRLSIFYSLVREFLNIMSMARPFSFISIT